MVGGIKNFVRSACLSSSVLLASADTLLAQDPVQKAQVKQSPETKQGFDVFAYIDRSSKNRTSSNYACAQTALDSLQKAKSIAGDNLNIAATVSIAGEDPSAQAFDGIGFIVAGIVCAGGLLCLRDVMRVAGDRKWSNIIPVLAAPAALAMAGYGTTLIYQAARPRDKVEYYSGQRTYLISQNSSPNFNSNIISERPTCFPPTKEELIGLREFFSNPKHQTIFYISAHGTSGEVGRISINGFSQVLSSKRQVDLFFRESCCGTDINDFVAICHQVKVVIASQDILYVGALPVTRVLVEAAK